MVTSTVVDRLHLVDAFFKLLFVMDITSVETAGMKTQQHVVSLLTEID